MEANRVIPEHLRPAYKMITAAYPQGVPEEDYFPLLALLKRHMSVRNTAEAVSSAFSMDYFMVLNDAYGPGGDPADIERVRDKLQQGGGYEEWEQED